MWSWVSSFILLSCVSKISGLISDNVVKQHKGDKYSIERYLVFFYLQILHTFLTEKLALCALDKSKLLMADGNWKPTLSFERESGIGEHENLCKILWTMHIPRAQDHQSKNKNIFKEFSMNRKCGPFVQTLLKNIRPQHQVLKPNMGPFRSPGGKVGLAKRAELWNWMPAYIFCSFFFSILCCTG